MAKAAKKEKKDTKKAATKAAPKSAKAAVAKKAAAPKPATKPKMEKPAEAPVIVEATAEVKVPAPKKESKAKKATRERLASEESKKWLDLKEKHAAAKAVPYSMSGVFESNQPLQHKVLGWGWILSVQNDRLEVIFEEGTKMLISNYKAR